MPDKKKRGNPLNQPWRPLFLRVHFFRYIAVVLFLSSGSMELLAQDQPKRKGSRILDDTTKQVYGPKTSRYFFERDVFFNRQTYHTIDTAIWNFHQYNYIQRNNNLYQDLGNIGTAIRPIFYMTPEVIGVTSGFTAYDLYWESEQIRNYDTKSPYTYMKVILGGKGRSTTTAAFSRNITPRWNFGFNYRGLLIDKQVQRQSKGDRNIRSTYYDLYTSFHTKDSTYRIFSNFRRNNLEADEYGGIKKNDGFQYEDYFFNNAQPQLTEASDHDLRMKFHLYHQYEIGKALQLYHSFDRYRQEVHFMDTPATAPEGYYDNVEVDSAKTDDKVKFKYVRNEVGIKGTLLKLFYNGYYAIRDYSMTNKYIMADTLKVATDGVENYLGGRISLKLDSLVEVTGWGELQDNGNYRLDGHIKSKWFEASLKQMQYSTPFVYQSYRGSHDVWNNDFNAVNVTQVNGYLHYKSRILNVSPGVTFTRLGNYVFFKQGNYAEFPNQKVVPIQASGQQVITSPELRFSLTVLRHITLSSQIIYTKLLSNSGDAIQVPDLFLNAQLAFANIFFNTNLDMQGGLDFHYRSDYYAPAYDVPIQQYYVQQSFVNQAYPLIDLFFNARIKRSRIFFKYNNIVQLFTKQGYIITPEYPGQRNILDFGFDWSFYD